MFYIPNESEDIWKNNGYSCSPQHCRSLICSRPISQLFNRRSEQSLRKAKRKLLWLVSFVRNQCARINYTCDLSRMAACRVCPSLLRGCSDQSCMPLKLLVERNSGNESMPNKPQNDWKLERELVNCSFRQALCTWSSICFMRVVWVS